MTPTGPRTRPTWQGQETPSNRGDVGRRQILPLTLVDPGWACGPRPGRHNSVSLPTMFPQGPTPERRTAPLGAMGFSMATETAADRC